MPTGVGIGADVIGARVQDGAELGLELGVVGMVEDVGEFVGVGFEVVHFTSARLQVDGELGAARARGAQAEADADAPGQ